MPNYNRTSRRVAREREPERPTRRQLEEQARAAANRDARGLSDRLTGHGRAAHGRDASGRQRRYATADNVRGRQDDAWQTLYETTLNRLLREHGYS
jgi:hypothetical protein